MIFEWISSLDNFELSQDDDVVTLKINNNQIGIIKDSYSTSYVSLDELIPILHCKTMTF